MKDINFSININILKKLEKFKKVAFIARIIIMLVIIGGSYYMFYPPLNIRAIETYIYVGILIIVYLLLFAVDKSKSKITRILLSLLIVIGSVVILGYVAGMEVFNASSYQKQLVVDDTKNFIDDVVLTNFKNLPLVDQETAKRLGDKKIGEVSSLGSQYDAVDLYTQQLLKDGFYRVTPLDYSGFFKWLENRNLGIPNYIKVNVADANDVQLVNLDEGMQYSPNAYFGNKIHRHVQMNYPTKILSDYHFEVDDEGTPYWVVSVVEPKIGLFSGKDVVGSIIVNAIDGSLNYYNLDEIPSFIDRVFPTELVMEQLNNWGWYKEGFWNTYFGQKNTLQVTEGYNYMLINDEVYAYTGMTSTGNDSSTVGFALINLKNKETSFYYIGGADENSGMISAEGQVQDLGYYANFPVLLNVYGEPTYLMALKDAGGLVKKYAFVNVANYQIVGIGNSIDETRDSYSLALSKNGRESITTTKTIKGIIETVHATAIVGGNTHYYFSLVGDETLYEASIAINYQLALTKSNDEVEMEVVIDESYGSVKEFTNISLKNK